MVNFGEKAKIKKAGNLNSGRSCVITTVPAPTYTYLYIKLYGPWSHQSFLWLRPWKLFKITITFMAGQGQSRLEVETRQEIKTVFRIKRLPREG